MGCGVGDPPNAKTIKKKKKKSLQYHDEKMSLVVSLSQSSCVSPVEEPNDTTAKKSGPLETIQYFSSTLIPLW